MGPSGIALLCVETSTRSQPVLQRELEIPSARPIRLDTNHCIEVRLGVGIVQHARSDEGKEVGRRLRVDVRTAKHPRFAPDSNDWRSALTGVVLQAKPTIVEKAKERGALAEGVPKRVCNGTAHLTNALENTLCPTEKLVKEWAGGKLKWGKALAARQAGDRMPLPTAQRTESPTRISRTALTAEPMEVDESLLSGPLVCLLHDAYRFFHG